ncbi:MAG: prenyltransferase [Candidatus Omnitrophota bacterium]
MIKGLTRALRLPFVTASILPFTFGSLIEREYFNVLGFILGLIAAISVHLSANLINDYADSKSGADWQDRKFYKFFGGSKLIQEKVFSEKFYLQLGIALAFLSLLSVVLLALVLRSPSVIIYYLVIIFLGWSYSAKPLQFSYRRLGEPVLFVLFGPALVMGGYFIQTGVFPDLRSFMLSLPFGFLVTLILFVNEIPDFAQDQKVSKFNWVSLTGSKKAFVTYYMLAFAALLAAFLNIWLGYLSVRVLSCLVFTVLIFKTGNILKRDFNHKTKLIQSSKLTIALQTLFGIMLILDLLICKKL